MKFFHESYMKPDILFIREKEEPVQIIIVTFKCQFNVFNQF
jgi:hypothetical protein